MGAEYSPIPGFYLFWLYWVFFPGTGLSLVVVSGAFFLLWCAGFSLQWLLLLWSRALGTQAAAVAAHRLSSYSLWTKLSRTGLGALRHVGSF